MKIALAVLIALTPVSAVADEYQRGYSASRTCYKSEYREEYVPGTADNPGYIKSWNETIEVPCGDRTTSSRTTIRRHTTVEYDTNDCSDSKIAGALIGGGAGAAMSRGEGRWWAIPLGAVIGGTIGCDIDGG